MISALVPPKKAKEIVIEGDNLFQVGFSFDALTLLPWMSGLVKIHDVFCNEHGVFFIVSSLDKTSQLFLTGTIQGSPLDSVKLPRQALYVSIDSLVPSTCQRYPSPQVVD
jgi:hypothetical protein